MSAINLSEIKNLMNSHFIMHRASYAGPKYYVSDPVNTMTPNTFGTFNLLNYTVKSIVRPFHTYGHSFALDDGRVFADFLADVIKKEIL